MRVLRHAYFNSFFQTGLKNLMDKAILAHVHELGFENLEERYRKIDEIPFDFTRRRMMLATVTIMAIGIVIPFTALGAKIGLVPLPLAYFPWLIATLLCYCFLTQVVKQWYIRKFSHWL